MKAHYYHWDRYPVKKIIAANTVVFQGAAQSAMPG
jgi:hypothetical protein